GSFDRAAPIFQPLLDAQRRTNPAQADDRLTLGFLLDEGSGIRVKNHVPSGLPRDVQGKADWVDDMTRGRVLQFDGQTHIEIGQAGILDRQQPYTLSAWIFPAGENNHTILSKMQGGGEYRGYDLCVNERRLTVHLVHAWPENAIKVETKSFISLHTWHHVAA